MNTVHSSAGSSETDRHPSRKRLWTVGTLTYTTGGLAAVFAWLLWGDFCLADAGSVDPAGFATGLQKVRGLRLPDRSAIQLDSPGYRPDSRPIISYLSDRHRGRWGRRIPYLFATTPFIVLAIIGLAFSPQIGKIVHRWFAPSLGLNDTTLIFLGSFLVLFEFACGVANMIFGGLVNDVVRSRSLDVSSAFSEW